MERGADVLAVDEYGDRALSMASKNGSTEIVKLINNMNKICGTGVALITPFNLDGSIDYLSLDVEGAEFEVLKNFPFDEYKFLSITIETSFSFLCFW